MDEVLILFLIQFGGLSAAIAAMSFTIAKTPVFQPLKDWLLPDHGYIRHGFDCPYCVSHWLAFAATAIYQPKPFSGQWYDLLFVPFVMVLLAAPMYQAIILVANMIRALEAFDDAASTVARHLDKTD